MKIAKNNIYLFVLIVLIGLYAYFVEYQGINKEAARKEAAMHLFSVQKDSVVKVRLKNVYGSFEFSKNSGNKWWILKPVVTEAEQEKINALLNQCATLKRDEDVEPFVAENPDEFGLQNPEIKIVLVTSRGEKDSVLVGTDSPVGNKLFAGKGDSLIVTIPASVKSQFSKGLFDWRNKKVVAFKQADIDSVIISGKSDIILTKKDGDWVVLPISKTGDRANITTLLSKFANAKYIRVVSEDKSDLKKYGLHKPKWKVTFVDREAANNQPSVVISVGKANGPNYYAMTDDKPLIFELDSNVVHYLAKPVDYFRNHDFATINNNQVDSVIVAYADTVLTLVKDSSNWMAWTDSGKVNVKNWKVTGLFSDLDFAEIKKFVDNPGLSDAITGFNKPSLRIKLFNNDNQIHEFIFGKKKRDLIYARNLSSEDIVLLPEKLQNECKLKLKDILED
ncbi:MAG: hypothetical protein Kow00108_16830 [Calditrichia bacterium]